MILGTVGTHTAPFNRLVRALDAYAARSPEEVVIQIGSSTYEPRHAAWFRMTTSEEMLTKMARSRVVVTHAADSMLEALRLRKPVIAVPRQRRFGEHIDDHQVDLARALAATGAVVHLEDLSAMAERLSDLATVSDAWEARSDARWRLVTAVRQAIVDAR